MKRLAIAVLLTVCVTTGAQTFLHPGGHGYTSGNMVTPLIDGVKTFSHANGLLKMVEASGGYVHLSFWECKADTVLDPADINPATGKPYMLKDRLKKIAEKGYEVKVLLWDPGDYGLAGIKAINEKSKATLEALDKNIEVQLLKHYTIKGSYHEKEMIFATPKEVTVIVGGLNMTNDYRDDKPHAHLSGMPYYYPTMPWHDVAVEICGPSTVPVELDFKLRWDKSRHRLPTAKGPTPVPPMPGRVPVWIGTENQVEGDEGIFHELLERIDKAERCIYLENFGIHEPKLMKALAEKMTKMRAAHMPFDVILMANNPKGDPIYGWLHYTTYCYLSMMGCDSFHYKNNDDKIETITRTPEADKAWGFNYRDDGKKGEGWHKMAQLWWAGPGKTAHATEIIYGDPKFDSPMPLGGNPIYHLVHADPGGSLTDVDRPTSTRVPCSQTARSRLSFRARRSLRSAPSCGANSVYHRIRPPGGL